MEELSAMPDFVFQTPGNQGPGLGPVSQSVVSLQGGVDTPVLMAGQVSVADLQPRIFEERSPWRN